MFQKRSKRAPRRKFTDQENEQLIRDVEQAGQEGRNAANLIRSLGHGPSWFYSMRRRYMEAHPKFDPSKPSTALAVRQVPVDATRETLDAIDDKLHSVRRKYKQRVKTRKHPWFELDELQLRPLVAGYLNLTGNGQKGPWLKKHGLNHQQIHELKIRAGLIPRAKSLVSRKPIPSPFAPPVNGAALVPQELHTPVPVSLDDAILAMEVKRDQLSGFIDDLKRMQRGHR